MQSVQAPSSVIMIRPHHFGCNRETAADNTFQSSSTDARIPESARREFDAVVQGLEAAGVTVHLFNDLPRAETPDSVFPNNWIASFPGGFVSIFPMYAPSRRLERRPDIVEFLKSRYRVRRVIDYSALELEGMYLEGTGVMVCDHVHRFAFVASSKRVTPKVLEYFCADHHYLPVTFEAFIGHGKPVYHTNVMMTVGTEFAMVSLELIPEALQRRQIELLLSDSGRKLVTLDAHQVGEFAGNALELTGSQGRVLAISSRGWRALAPEQRRVIEACSTPLLFDVPTIELSGGSVRCMLADIHLEPREAVVG